VAEGQAAHGAAIIRPPGHHAESNVAQGFCFFNNAAVAARAAQATGKVQRVLILDWDIHHGKIAFEWPWSTWMSCSTIALVLPSLFMSVPAILDGACVWDLCVSGNGTQHIFEDDSSVMYMSLHRYDQ
jgi:hypothetical protein